MIRQIIKYGHSFFLFPFIFLLVSCAQIVTPGGGPKDLAPPRVEKYIPDSAATNFSAKNISIVFDEFIQLTDLQKELTISPPMNIQPEIKVKGKMLLIEMKDTLRKNTTYTLNFGSAIRDFTENNARKDFQYIFSTGNFIDTLKLSGTVKNAFDQKTDKGILVMLYESSEDSVPMKKRPSYFAKTNADGTYKISNIRPGKYKAFALKETNADYRYDSPDESIAFSDTLVKISRNVKLDMLLFREEAKEQKLLKNSTKGYGNMTLVYAKPVGSVTFKALNKATPCETFITEYSSKRDTLSLWFPKFGKDSLCFQVAADENTVDTIRIFTGQFQKETGGRGDVFRLIAGTNVNPASKFDLNKNIILKFNHPISVSQSRPENVCISSNGRRIDYSNRDSVRVDPRNFRFQFPLAADSTYILNVPASSFTDVFDMSNDTVKLKFQTQEEKFYGTLKLNLKMKYRIAYVLEFINEKGVMFEPVSTDKSIFSYTFLPPGNYTLRITYDKNGDGRWTPGNYKLHKQPEKVIYYPNPIVIRSNWDSELEWQVE